MSYKLSIRLFDLGGLYPQCPQILSCPYPHPYPIPAPVLFPDPVTVPKFLQVTCVSNGVLDKDVGNVGDMKLISRAGAIVQQ